jgi:integrase
MAFIAKRPSGNWQVRWTDPDGRSRARTLRTKRAAEKLKREVEDLVSSGRRWEPQDAREVADLRVISGQYIRACALRLRPRTLHRYAENLEVFLRFVEERHGSPPHNASILSKPMMEDYYSWLQEPQNGLHERQRKADTARKIVEVAQLMWLWAEDSDRWPEQIPRPRKVDMKRAQSRRVSAPSWEQMDRCIAVSSGWQAKLLTVLRFTGLRVGETMLLTWDDIDLDEAELFINASISKNGRERNIPISPLLVAELAGWGLRTGYLIPSPRAKGPRYRQPRARDVGRAWQRAGVSERIWKQSPHHAFRKGFKSEMLRAGAPADAVDFLQGHVPRGGRGRYIDMERAFDWDQVLGLIPAVGSDVVQLSQLGEATR